MGRQYTAAVDSGFVPSFVPIHEFFTPPRYTSFVVPGTKRASRHQTELTSASSAASRAEAQQREGGPSAVNAFG